MAESIEVIVARLEERFIGVTRVLEELALDQKGLTRAYQELVHQNQHVGILETNLTHLEQSHKILFDKFDAHEAAQRSAGWTIVYDTFKLVLAVVLGVFAGHWIPK